MPIQSPEPPATNGAHPIIPHRKKAVPKSIEKPYDSSAENGAIEPQWQVVPLPVNQIAPSPYQPRLVFDEAEMAELVASVKQHGVQQPILVRTAKTSGDTDGSSTAKRNDTLSPTPDTQSKASNATRYELIAGERRLRACKQAKRRFIPAIIRDDLTDSQAAELALLENIQRANLTVIEEARGYKRLMLEFRLKEERIAKRVGKSVQSVRDTLKLLTLPESVQSLLASRKLTASHGQHLLKLAPFEELCTMVALHAESTGLTATALGRNLLPNVRKLQEKKLVVPLDYRTKFDWKNVCGHCPHKAYFTGESGSYCAKPLEWNRKQSEAIELQKLEAARVLEEAKSREGAVDVTVLLSGSYRDLSYGQPPAGCCESCACRSMAALPHDPTRTRPICLNPERYNELARIQRQAFEEERKRKYLGFYQEAKAKLTPTVKLTPTTTSDAMEKPCNGDTNHGADNGVSTGSFLSSANAGCVSILALTIISGDHLGYMDRAKWSQLCQEVAGDLSLELPWEKWGDERSSIAEMIGDLRSVEPVHLLRFAACVLLGHEALQAMRYGGETPLLSALLGHSAAQQTEFSADEFSANACQAEEGEMEDDEIEIPDDLNAGDFEGEEFEDERYHRNELTIEDDPIQDRTAHHFQDEPYQGSPAETEIK